MSGPKKPFHVTCVECSGAGSYETQHPQWGSPSCPEAYVQVTCEPCDGKGELPYDRDTLLSDLFEILNEKHEQPYEDVAEVIVARLETMDLVPQRSSVERRAAAVKSAA